MGRACRRKESRRLDRSFQLREGCHVADLLTQPFAKDTARCGVLKEDYYQPRDAGQASSVGFNSAFYCT
jgi:hypothetical protein